MFFEKLPDPSKNSLVQEDMNALPRMDHLRQTFMNLSRTSTGFLNSVPTVANSFCNVDFHQANQDYYGVESSQCAAHVGARLGPRRRGVLDKFGSNLLTTCFPGDWWRKRHDWTKWEIAHWLSYCSVDYTCEPLNLFLACINQQAAFHDQSLRQKQSIIPDFMVRFFPKPQGLEELKFTAAKADFNRTTVLTRCGGVEHRAVKVEPQYFTKAVNTDRVSNNWDRDQNGPGPVEIRLKSFGVVKALVFGPRGESSKDVESLIKACAESGGERRWRELGARSAVEATAFIANRMRKAIGITAVRANAMVKREALGIVLGNGNAGAARRGPNLFRKRMCEEYYSWWTGGRFD